MDDEYDLVQNNKTWELVSLPVGINIFQCKWMYKTKLVADGYTTKYKAWLVTKGYSQVHGLDYNETFVHVARMDSIRMVLAIAASKKWEVHHMDVKSAFLHSELIYMRHPEGYIENYSFV